MVDTSLEIQSIFWHYFKMVFQTKDKRRIEEVRREITVLSKTF